LRGAGRTGSCTGKQELLLAMEFLGLHAEGRLRDEGGTHIARAFVAIEDGLGRVDSIDSRSLVQAMTQQVRNLLERAKAAFATGEPELAHAWLTQAQVELRAVRLRDA
jgi:hypothetical protein